MTDFLKALNQTSRIRGFLFCDKGLALVWQGEPPLDMSQALKELGLPSSWIALSTSYMDDDILVTILKDFGDLNDPR